MLSPSSAPVCAFNSLCVAVFGPLQMPRCRFRWKLVANDLWHLAHANSRTPMCTFRCRLKFSFFQNTFAQLSCVQWYRRSRVCMYACCLTSAARANMRSQKRHCSRFSPVCVSWCMSRWAFCRNVRLHSLHANLRSPADRTRVLSCMCRRNSHLRRVFLYDKNAREVVKVSNVCSKVFSRCLFSHTRLLILFTPSGT